MSNRNDALCALREFLVHPSDASAKTLSPHLTADVEVSVHTTNEKGLKAAFPALVESLFQNVVHGGEWDEPATDGNIVTQVLVLPTQAIAEAVTFQFTFGNDDKVEKIFGKWVLPPRPLSPEPVIFTTAIHNKINNAEKDGYPLLLAYLTAAGCPEQIYRSTTSTISNDQLAFWNPKSDGSLIDSIAGNPVINICYRDSVSHEMLEISGRARIADDEDSEKIYNEHAAVIQSDDPNKDGVAIVIDIDRVNGLIHAADTGAIERILMERNQS